MQGRRILGIAAVVFGLAFSLSGVGRSPARAVPKAGCPGVWFIGARGSGESSSGYDGMGPAVDHLASVAAADLAAKGIGLGRLADNYRADSVSDLKPNKTVLGLLAAGQVTEAVAEYIHSSVDRYDSSIGDGITNAEYDVGTVLADCPDAKIIMAGYSQGAAVIHDAENYLAAKQPAEFSHVAGTLLLADPDRVGSSKSKRFGTAPTGARGLRVSLKLVKAHDVPDPGTTADIANMNDIIDNFSVNSIRHFKAAAKVHTSYAHVANGQMVYDPILGAAANWIISNIPGAGSPDPSIKIGSTDYGSLPAGQTTREHLTATGGSGPYTFHVYGPDLTPVPAWVTLSAGGILTVDPPDGASATVAFHVYAIDKAKQHSPFTDGLVLFTVGAGRAGNPSFAKSDELLGRDGLSSPQTDCVTAAFCLAIGTGGEVHSFNGTAWTDRLGLSGSSAQSVSCASATFCAVAVYNGIYTTDNGSRWDNFYASSGPEQYVSCPAAGQCVVATSSSSSELDNGVFSGHAPLPAHYNLLGLGCASVSFCLAMGEAGPSSDVEITTFNGAKWSALSKVAPPENLDAPSCTPGGSCYLAGNGKAYSFSPSGRTLLGAPSGQSLVAVSCASKSSCQASTQSGRVASYNGHAWSTGPVVDPGSSLATMSCPTSAFCAGQSAEGYTAYLKNGSWTAAKRTDPDGLVAAISCPSAKFCAALDTEGEVSFFNGTKWSAAKMVDPLDNAYQAGSIACPTASFCAMVDSNGRAFTFNGKRWSAAKKLSATWVDSVSCATSTMCAAIDGDGFAYVFNGKTWSTGHYTNVGRGGYLQAISCPAVDFCMAVGGHSAASYNGGTWTKPVTIAPATASLHAVSCTSPTFCLAGDRDSADLVAYFDGAWTKPWSLHQVFFDDAISCLSTFVCVTVGDQGGAYITGKSARWLPLSGLNDESLAVDCPSASACFAGVGATIRW
jgi:hypothetical protein